MVAPISPGAEANPCNCTSHALHNKNLCNICAIPCCPAPRTNMRSACELPRVYARHMCHNSTQHNETSPWPSMSDGMRKVPKNVTTHAIWYMEFLPTQYWAPRPRKSGRVVGTTTPDKSPHSQTSPNMEVSQAALRPTTRTQDDSRWRVGRIQIPLSTSWPARKRTPTYLLM